MNKMELVKALQIKSGIPKYDAAKVIEIFFDSMADALGKGNRVEVRRLCNFFVKKYKSYTGRNPKTGEKVKIKPKKLPFFKLEKNCGKGLIMAEYIYNSLTTSNFNFSRSR